jgi:MoxR-like ATPase
MTISIERVPESIDKLRSTIASVIVGQVQTIDLLIVAMLADGHVLIEGVPGVAKTLSARLLASLVQCSFARIQLTPDLMPADIIGSSIYDPSTLQFSFRKGPVFANIVLCDEINRAPAKTQSALFEVMEERQITVDRTSHKLQAPFLVLATQNPIEQEGTYRLPEAQLDRFLFKIVVPYPTASEESLIMQRSISRSGAQHLQGITPVLSSEEFIEIQTLVHSVTVEASLVDYIASIVHATRNHPSLALGASPRASLGILQASRAMALTQGRAYVIPDDIQAVATAVLRHRIELTAEREMEGSTTSIVVADILKAIDVPR